jgi:nitrate reductase delta subunit
VELIRALGLLAEPPSGEHGRVAELLGLGEPPPASEYTELFLLNLYPYASVYLSEDGMLGGGPADRVAGFWRAVGQSPPAEPDHLSALLGLYVSLDEAGEAEEDRAASLLISNAADTLLHDHLLCWVPSYLRAVATLGSPFYGGWAALLSEALQNAACDRAPAPESGANPHFAGLSRIGDPREQGGEAFLKGLLAPARCGFILSGTDLSRAARTLDVGSRIGERKFRLKALLSQDAEGTLRWLLSEATQWAAWHSSEGFWAGDGARAHWVAQSTRTRELLESLLAGGWDAQDDSGD